MMWKHNKAYKHSMTRKGDLLTVARTAKLHAGDLLGCHVVRQWHL
jgi:hypothetical protein